MFGFIALFALGAAASAAPITTAPEQRQFVEDLSGTAIEDRYSDGSGIKTAVRYLQSKYSEWGMNAVALDYFPTDALPFYARNTDETYRAYFRRLIPEFRADFDGLCAGTLTAERLERVTRRLVRVGLEPATFCAVADEDRVETYVARSIAHTVESTRKALESRSNATWLNVVAFVGTTVTDGLFGSADGRPLCVVGAHMDSVVRAPGGRGPVLSPAVPAPGADDNASGTAAVMVLARAMRAHLEKNDGPRPCDFAFVHFSGEEEGLIGSLIFLHEHLKRPVLWMLNLDMIGYNRAPEAVMNIGYDARLGRGLVDLFVGTSSSPALKKVVVERQDHLYSSDQISFWDAGIPALSISEQACSDERCSNPFQHFNPNLHTAEDKAAILDFDYSASIVEETFQGMLRLLTGTPASPLSGKSK